MVIPIITGGPYCTGSPKQVTEHNKCENTGAPAALVLSPALRCFSLWLSTNSAHQVPWEPSGWLQFGVFKIPRQGMSISPLGFSHGD